MPDIPADIWIAWLAALITSFGVIEGIALVNKAKGDTLSERTRQWLGIDPPKPQRHLYIPLFVASLVGLVAWFITHILGG